MWHADTHKNSESGGIFKIRKNKLETTNGNRDNEK